MLGSEGTIAQCHCQLSKKVSPGSVSFHGFLSFGNGPTFFTKFYALDHFTLALFPLFSDCYKADEGQVTESESQASEDLRC